ncbi:MAG: LCP family protein [Actinomycetota bacterium]
MTDSNLDALIQSQKPRKRFNWPRFGKIFAIAVLIVGVLAGATAFIVYKYVEHKFNASGDPNIQVTGRHSGPPLPAAVEILHPVNILVLGSDSRDVVENSSGRPQADTSSPTTKPAYGSGHCGDYCMGGQRSDTLMLVHLTDQGRKAIVLSFPRDLRVQLHGHSGLEKINAAYNYGPNEVMQTVTDLTGIPIDHYVEVNFESFKSIVSAVGGVNMCVDRAYNDAKSGLYINKPGCYPFDGNKALAFVRMRYQDPLGDYGRIQRQQYFIRTLIDKLKSTGFILNLPRVIQTANAISKGVKHDTQLSLGLVRTLAEKLGSSGSKNVDFRVVPSHAEYIGGVSYVIADEPYATQMYAALRNDTGAGPVLPDVGKNNLSMPAPTDVTLDIENASGIKGAAAWWAAKLRKMGYTIRYVLTARKNRSVTQIAYRPLLDRKAQLLAETFIGAQIVQSVNLSHAVDCVVLIGKDYGAQAAPSTSPRPYPS